MSVALPAVAAFILNGIEAGLHSGAQVCVWKDGAVAADLAFGEASPGTPMRPNSLTSWMSSGKPLLAVALAQLVERGELCFEDAAADHVPEFSANGKADIDLLSLLTHTSGLPNERPSASTWDELVAAICATHVLEGWVPGGAGYNVGNGWVILAEVLRRVDGRHYDRYAREEILLPLGMADSWINLAGSQLSGYGDRVAILYDTEGETPASSNWLLSSDDIYWPGGSARGPAGELVRFYDMMLNDGRAGEVWILRPESAVSLTQRRRLGKIDKTFGYTLDWGLGFMIDSKRYGRRDYAYSFGEHASDGAYGHGGYQSSMAFADPAHNLAVAWTLNGMPGERAHRPRNHEINSAIYTDLDLV